jgi:hypothetical protein
MRYADDLCRSAPLPRLLPLREKERYRAALDMRFASETQPDPNPLLPYARFLAANFDRRLSAHGRLLHVATSRRFTGDYSPSSDLRERPPSGSGALIEKAVEGYGPHNKDPDVRRGLLPLIAEQIRTGASLTLDRSTERSGTAHPSQASPAGRKRPICHQSWTAELARYRGPMSAVHNSNGE